MSLLHRELADRIENEVVDLNGVVERALGSWEQGRKAPADQEVYLDSVALNLHGFYSGLERLFELIARHIDRSIPAGASWHRELLEQMASDVPRVRPAVISRENAAALDQFRRFRHLVRNVYTVSLAPDRMTGLLSALPGLWKGLQLELQAFAAFMKELAQ